MTGEIGVLDDTGATALILSMVLILGTDHIAPNQFHSLILLPFQHAP
jgi:hypothetical protein